MNKYQEKQTSRGPGSLTTSSINTMSKKVDNTKINQTEVSIPDKEIHGLWLAASNALKTLQTIQETKITIEAAYLGRLHSHK